jgi:hypothetical protein
VPAPRPLFIPGAAPVEARTDQKAARPPAG